MRQNFLHELRTYFLMSLMKCTELNCDDYYNEFDLSLIDMQNTGVYSNLTRKAIIIFYCT